ncbi:MAG: outer membrane protein assembly factor BamD [Acidobacteriota bacterium]|nr:outer membrane protein assembly factor BamD [Acidobacteriota bacterium]
MFFSKNKAVILSLMIVFSFVAGATAQQNKTSEGSPAQRLEVASQKLNSLRRSVGGAISAFKDDGSGNKSKKDDKNSPETPVSRLKSLDKEASRAQSEITGLRGKIDRSEKYEISEIDQLETSVADLQSRIDKTLTETASARSNVESNVGKPREPKKKGKFLGIFGGGTDEFEELIGTVTPGRDKELFIVATREVRKNNYDVGRLLFQTIITTYPDSPYLPMAKLAVADSFYLEGSTSALIQATQGYQDWLTFFPTHPLADRVLLKIAESSMRQIGLPDRDSTHAKRAEQRLRALLQQYPNTILIKDAEQRLEEVQDNLGLHNLYIANYYYTLSVNQKKGGLKGAQSRYREILDKYPNFTFMDEALYRLAVTYLIEEETDQAAKYFQTLVRDYPNSGYVEKAKEQLQVIGSSVPEPNPERTKVLPPEKKSFFANFKNELFGIYPLTIDKNGVLMTDNFDKTKFELIDQIIENEGDIPASQIPKSLTTVISQTQKQSQK